MGELAAIGTALCWSFGSICFTISSRRIGHHTVNRLRLVVGLMLLLIAHLIITGRVIPTGVTPFHWFWFGLSGVIGFVIGDTMLFRSFVLIGPRLGMLMMALVPVFSTIIAWLFLRETLDIMDLLAIAITISGISWVVLSRPQQSDKKSNRLHMSGLLLGIGGALGQAIGLILSKKGLAGNFPALTGNILRIFTATLLIWIFALVKGLVPATIRSFNDRYAIRTMCGGAFLGPFLGVWLSLIAVQHTFVGIASTLMALPPIFLLPLSYWIFKEKITTAAIMGTLVAIVGVALIFLL